MGICIVFAVVSSIMSQPLKLDASVTLDDVTFNYPSEWQLEEVAPDSNIKGKYLIKAPNAMVSITEIPSSASDTTGYQDSTVEVGQKAQLSVSGKVAYKAAVDLEHSGRKGQLLSIEMGSRKVVCIAVASESAPPSFPATIEAIIDSAHVESINEEITVTYMDGDTVVKEETVYNKGGGATVVPPTDLTKDGYVLTGWQLASESVDVDMSGSGNSTKVQHITEDITLQAQWGKTWTVTFTDGSGNVLETETVTEGKSATAPKNPTREGFEFDGWSSELGPITSDTVINAKWKKEYESIPYSELARNPDAYKGKKIEISGRVLQVSEGSSENQLRVATSGNYDDVVMVGYNPKLVSSRVLEDDRVTVYGTYVGIYSYTSVMGATISVPGVSAKSIKVN